MPAVSSTLIAGMKAHPVRFCRLHVPFESTLTSLNALGIVSLSSIDDSPCRDTVARFPHDLCCHSWVRGWLASQKSDETNPRHSHPIASFGIAKGQISTADRKRWMNNDFIHVHLLSSDVLYHVRNFDDGK